MLNRNPHERLWTLIGKLEREVLEAWRKEHVPHANFEVALATQLMSVQTRVERTRGGNVSVTFEVLGNLDGQEHNDYFRLQRAGNRLYKIADPV
jgi:hypothetical protein